MPEKSHLLEPKLTFAEFGIKLMVAKPLQNCSKLLLVFILALGVNEYVIDQDYHELIEEVHEYFVHHMHEESRGIGETKAHHGIFINTVPSSDAVLGISYFLILS